ncbi:seed biotin-containing protein SBP65-like [Impatiens glandulifera]|uniref:seed biotin-containing protein SBP65-like n=1 Tax=Impatiens glandulifera TaxID=253017 RepID=UPI001FB0ECB9|nr:seed biotin-containing protein SBP65-like [Impatiens glandulifera]
MTNNLDNVARNILYQSINMNVFYVIKSCSSAKEIWDKLNQIYGTSTQAKKDQKAFMCNENKYRWADSDSEESPAEKRMKLSHFSKDKMCTASQLGKQGRSSFKNKTSVKDTTVDTAKKVGTFVEEKTIVAAEYSEKAAVEAKKVGSYVGEKAVVAKEVAVEAGINAVVFSEKVTVEAKDRAVVAGWGVAHYTVEVAGGAAGFIEGKAAAGNWGTVADYVKEKAAAAKDASASAEEYTARKKASAERGMEANKERLSSSDETSSSVDLGR